MSSTVSIRVAADDDVRVAMELVRACIVEMRRDGIDQWDDLYPDEMTLRADIRERTMYVTSDDAGVCGTFVLNEYQLPEYVDAFWTITDTPVAVVHRLMVHPRKQHQGIARQLMDAAELHALALGFGAIRLDAFAHNPRALRLYEYLGYRDAGGVMLRKGLFRCFEKRLR